MYHDDLGHYSLEKLSSRTWICRGVISFATHSSFVGNNESVLNSERGELVNCSVSLMVYSARSMAHYYVTGTYMASVKRIISGHCVGN